MGAVTEWLDAGAAANEPTAGTATADRPITTFAQIEEQVLSSGIKVRVALAGAHDTYSLEALARAHDRGLVEAVLLGEQTRVEAALRELSADPAAFEIVDCPDDDACARRAVEMVRAGEADMPMKGLLQTSTYMHAILNKENGLLPPGGLLSQSTLVEWLSEQRMFQITDCAINIAPTLEQKKELIKNTVSLGHMLGWECPRVAVVSAVEKVNEKIPSTVDAVKLVEAARAGELGRCMVEGPLALDNAVSVEAAQHKGIAGEVAGRADILLMPDLCAGNILTKSLTFFAHMRSAGCLLGTVKPVIATSRTDTPENKYCGILVALLQAVS